MLTLLTLTLLLGILGLAAYSAHKLRRIHTKQFDSEQRAEDRLATHFAQVESLMALNLELALPRGLQPTRGWAGSPDFLLQVLRVAMERKPKIVVECSSGVSTVVLARAMQLVGIGHVWSLEHDRAFADKTRAELRRHGLEAWATVIDAPLVPLKLAEGTWNWYDVRALPEGLIDMLVVDGPPMTLQRLSRFPAIPVLDKKLAQTAVVMLDDSQRSDESEAVRQWSANYGWHQPVAVYAEKGLAQLRRAGSPES
jgi:predicted O-methyltransferase YrrM